uniref:MATH domain-containing protein n=1 Tax=Chromera velia CCMP2878 TaxID=1169474 RepID=A0A0G4G7W9_9ALVE|eukprot:Cvel_4319.t1-p1 / transcript=Cvel_4319.t1 / gene=Cvel_4319 / organism=Chromera_velia_CCMP2878 / gene_product=hypothetical protein / transcript_product=hypothetical protein / location=Cvel_scaffold187:57594-58815(-) / protein_length=152 / sequence_SO=supercontig / SO=protein_coding / is_pseudo=false
MQHTCRYKRAKFDILKVKVCLPDYEAKAAEKAKGSRLSSGTFTFQGFRFCLLVYPKGDNRASENNASIHLKKLDDYAMEMVYSVEAGGNKRQNKKKFAGIPVGGGVAWRDFCESASLLSAARGTDGGALEIWVSLSAPESGSQSLEVRGYGD